MSKFKIGDKVRVIASEEELQQYNTDTNLIKTGEVYTVQDGLPYSRELLLGEEYTCSWVEEHMIELVEPEEETVEYILVNTQVCTCESKAGSLDKINKYIIKNYSHSPEKLEYLMVYPVGKPLTPVSSFNLEWKEWEELIK